MNFLGASNLSQSRSDLLTPVGQLIDQATSDSLLAPDWALNLAVCDAINYDNDGTSSTGEQAVRAFRRKLRDSNPKVVQLTLTLLEAAVKNADKPGRDSAFHALVGTSEFLSNVATLTDGKKGWDVKEQALSLIQEWGLSFQAKQATLAFYSTYMDLRLQGVQFPRLEASSPIFTPPAQTLSSSSSSPSPSITTTPTPEAELSTSATAAATGAKEAAAAIKNKGIAELAKLGDDLREVRGRARACIELLPTSRGIAAGDEALAGVIGFLEACKPRLADVIEIGMEEGRVESGGEGGVTEGVLELALEVHEEVVQALEAEKAHAMLRQKGGEEGERKAGLGEAAAVETGQTDDLLDFDQHPPPAQAQRPIPTHPDLTMTEVAVGEGRDHRAGKRGESSNVQLAPRDPLGLFDAVSSPAPPAARDAHVEPASGSPLPTSSLSGLRLDDNVPRTKHHTTQDLYRDLESRLHMSAPCSTRRRLLAGSFALLLVLMMLVAPVVTQAAPKEKMPEGAPVAAEVTNTEDGGVLPIPSMQAEAPGAERHLEGRQIEAEEQSQDGIPVEEEQAEEGVENELEKDEHNAAVAAAGGVPSTSPPEPPEKSLLDIMRIIGKRALGGGIPGALAGGLQVATLMWLRTVGNYQYRYGSSFTETVATLYKQGGIGRFYEGMGFALVQGPLSRFGSTAANDGCRALLKNFESTRDLPIFFSTFVASIAAGAWRLVLMPIDTSKTVLQVEGNEGYRSLMRRISRGEFSAFYQGALATAAAAAFGHFPWFYVYGVLDEALRAPVGVLGKLCRNAFIGFMASAVSDALTNVIRVIKTTKQATASLSSISYMQTVQIILAADGWKGLFGRGLSTRILTNGLQSILFTVVWRALSESTYFKTMVEPNYEDDDDGTGTNSERAAQESTFLEQPLHKQQQHHQKPRGPLRGAAGQAQAAEKKKTHQD